MNDKDTTRVRLMIITPTVECGGSEKFVSLICNYIDTNRFSVYLVVVNNAKQFYKIKNEAIKIVDLKKKRVLFSLPAIKKTVKDFKPDIIFSTANHLNVYLAFFKHQFSKQIKWVAREASIVSITSKKAPIPVLYELLIKKYYKRFDIIICQSAYMQQDLVNHYLIPANKILIVHNATAEVLVSLIKPEQQEAERVYKFITIARLSEEKGIERLIHAVSLLIVPFKYYIIGEGNKRNELQKLINDLRLQDRVILTGQKSNPFSGMEDADLLLIGSFYEGFPNVLLEAGAHGIPVVAFNVPGGIAEIITTNENGLIVDDKDAVAFAAAIKKALTVNFERQKIIATTKDRFSVIYMMETIQNIFLKLAQNK